MAATRLILCAESQGVGRKGNVFQELGQEYGVSMKGKSSAGDLETKREISPGEIAPGMANDYDIL